MGINLKLNHQKLTGEWHKHNRKRLGFRKIANKKLRSILKKLQKEQEYD